MPIRFLDTSALKHRYTKNGDLTSRIRRIVSDKRYECYIADWTVVEIASALGDHCRGNNMGIQHFDKMNQKFFGDLASGRVKVRVTNSRGMLQARTLLRKGVSIRRNVHTGDALLAACCRELALDAGERVTFYTSDWKLYKLLRDIDAYRSVMRLRFVGIAKEGIPPTTG